MTFFLSVNVACDVAKNFKVQLKIPSVLDAVITPFRPEETGEENGHGYDQLMTVLLTISSGNDVLPPVSGI